MPALTGEELGLYLPRSKRSFTRRARCRNLRVRFFPTESECSAPSSKRRSGRGIYRFADTSCGKGFFLCQNAVKSKGTPPARALAEEYPGNYGGKIGIIGAGAIGKLVIGRLKGGAGITGGPDILVFDPFLSDLQLTPWALKNARWKGFSPSALLFPTTLQTTRRHGGCLIISFFHAWARTPRLSTPGAALRWSKQT